MNRIRCPIHNYVNLSEGALRIIDLPEFQRLRRIKQLGMAFMVYPGAQHTRFEHSIGVYHLGNVVSDQLGMQEQDRETVKFSGILHDIGHGPFSHIMENISRMTHEERSAEKIMNGRLSEVLKDMGLNPREIAKTVLGKSRLSPLISSEIDIDRMDYLLRDAHYTGVSTGLDAGRLTAVMELHRDNLVFRESGLGAVEALLIARFMMFPYIYYHHTARASERMLGRAIIMLENDEFASMGELWNMDDTELVSALRNSKGVPRELMRRIDERRLYKRGWEVSLSQLHKMTKSGRTPLRLLNYMKKSLTQKKLSGLEKEIGELVGISPEKVILDIPLPPELNSKDIFIRTRNGEVVTVRKLSRLISNLEKAQLDHWKIRVFVPDEFRELAQKKLKKTVPDMIGTQ